MNRTFVHESRGKVLVIEKDEDTIFGAIPRIGNFDQRILGMLNMKTKRAETLLEEWGYTEEQTCDWS